MLEARLGIADEIDRVLRGVRALGNETEPPPRGVAPAPEPDATEPAPETRETRTPEQPPHSPPDAQPAAGPEPALNGPPAGDAQPDDAPRPDEHPPGTRPAPGHDEAETAEEDAGASPNGLAATLFLDTTRAEQALKRLETAAFVSETLGLGYHLGGAIERIAAGAGGGSGGVGALREATWLIERYIAIVEGRPLGADLHACTVKLGRTGELIAELRALSASLDAQPEPPVSDSAWPRAAGEPQAASKAEAEAPRPPAEQQAPAEPVPPAPAPTAAAPPAPPLQPLWREIVLTAARWLIMVTAVALAVLVVTLIGQWR